MLARAPIRLRLTAWYVLLLAVILAAFCAAVYLLQRNALLSNLDESLENRADSLAAVVPVGDSTAASSGRPTTSLTEREEFSRVFNADGNVVSNDAAGLGGVPVDEPSVAQALAGETVHRSVNSGNDERLRSALAPIRRDSRIVGAVEVGRTEDDATESLATLIWIMAAAYGVTLLAAGGGGLFLAQRALAPIDTVTRLARDLSADDLSQRLDLKLPDDEVGRLAATFDDMIGRLEAAFRRQRQFTSDASHELRTPLTALKGDIEVALQKERDPEAYRVVLRAVNNDVDRLIRLVGTLLMLARADTGELPIAVEPVELGTLAEGAVEQLRHIALERGVTITLAGGAPVTVEADEDLLLQLLINLLDNAFKHTPREGHVDVQWAVQEGIARLSVTDTGEGIGPEHLPRIFDRFYRVDPARSRADGSVGLGLAISRWIAEAHHGSISVVSAPGEGTSFSVALPIKSPSS